MTRRIMYLEYKTDQNHRGEAWIGEVSFSKSGQTIYFNDQAFKKFKNVRVSGNYYNLETGDEYWISGVKSDGQDRHWAGSGKIKIERRIVKDYLKLVSFKSIDKANFEVVEIKETDVSRFNLIENFK